MILISIAMGACIGLLSVFLGLGGGVLLVPLLPLAFGLEFKPTIATSLLTIFIVVLFNTWQFHVDKLVRWPVALVMGPASAVAAYLASNFAISAPEKILHAVLAVIMLGVALKTIIGFQVAAPSVVAPVKGTMRFKAAGAGVFAGIASGLTGIGSGTILGPLMLHWKLVGANQLTPTANANMVFTTGAGALAFIYAGSFAWPTYGKIHLDIVLGVSIAAMVVSSLVRPYQKLLPVAIKAYCLSGLLLLVSGRIFYSALKAWEIL